VTQILEAWARWQEALRGREKENGLNIAEHRYSIAADEYDELLVDLLKTKSRTVEGVLAKARAASIYMLSPESAAEKIADDSRIMGPDEDIVAMSIACDLAALARCGSEAAVKASATTGGSHV
jgi:hypothetical protein